MTLGVAYCPTGRHDRPAVAVQQKLVPFLQNCNWLTIVASSLVTVHADAKFGSYRSQESGQVLRFLSRLPACLPPRSPTNPALPSATPSSPALPLAAPPFSISSTGLTALPTFGPLCVRSRAVSPLPSKDAAGAPVSPAPVPVDFVPRSPFHHLLLHVTRNLPRLAMPLLHLLFKCWRYVGLSWTYLGPLLPPHSPMLPVCWPMSTLCCRALALSCPYIGLMVACVPAMLASLWTYLGPLLPLCSPLLIVCSPLSALCWPQLALSCPVVGLMVAYVGAMLAYLHPMLPYVDPVLSTARVLAGGLRSVTEGYRGSPPQPSPPRSHPVPTPSPPRSHPVPTSAVSVTAMGESISKANIGEHRVNIGAR